MLEDTQKYLLEAQIDYWREMISLNAGKVSDSAIKSMRWYLQQAQRELAESQRSYLRLVA